MTEDYFAKYSTKISNLPAAAEERKRLLHTQGSVASTLRQTIDFGGASDAISHGSLLPTSNFSTNGDVASEAESCTDVTARAKSRLESLDVVRGLTVCLMFLVDELGNPFGDYISRPVNKPLVWFGMHHAPWDQIAVADFVMPFFLFIMGVGMALTFVKYPGKYNLLRKVVVRAGKLFVCIRASGLILIWVIEFTPSTKQFCMRSLPRPHT
eukprot:m.1411040 g.1411040  ORF g.1411040 m.1411040 type:complete len:211 (-) comp25028_c0_seq4:4574-5206(-)